MKRLIISCLLTSLIPFLGFSNVSLSKEEAYALGMRVWENESGRSIEGLTWWNPNEDFPSLGIGHFIWFPKKMKKDYHETFPTLLSFLKEQGVKLPKWLDKEGVACPWSTRASFQKDFKGKKMKELRDLLENTISEQALFIAHRLESSLPRILQGIEGERKEHIEKMFKYLSRSPQGVYALADYINFKGEGVSEMERHRSGGWGLRQVLEGMPKDTQQKKAVWEFVRSAKKRLLERVIENPERKDERRWLIGWKKRLDSYLTP